MSRLAPDLKMAMRFLDLLGPGEDFTFQTLADRKVDRHHAATAGYKPLVLQYVLHGSFSSHATELTHLNQLGAGVFVMVNEGDGRRDERRKTCRTESNVIRVRALFVDLDGSPLEPVLKHAIPPQIVVETSPSRWHAYWTVEGCKLENFKTAQQKLIAQFHSDPQVCDLPRVMRVPGFYHQKAEPYMTRLICPKE